MVSVKGGGSPKTGPLELGKLNMQTLRVLTQTIPMLPEQKHGSWKGSFRHVGELLQKALKANADFCADVFVPFETKKREYVGSLRITDGRALPIAISTSSR